MLLSDALNTRTGSKSKSRKSEWFGYVVSDDMKVTVSPRQITSVNDTSSRQSEADKPVGLWYACGGEWIDFIHRKEWKDRLDAGRYLYEINPNYSTGNVSDGAETVYIGGVLRISTEDDINTFTDLFAHHEDSEILYWDVVAEVWDGVEVCPYQRKLRRSRNHKWYRNWDVASGCVWRPEGILSLSLLRSRT